jgi:hypothetical protein
VHQTGLGSVMGFQWVESEVYDMIAFVGIGLYMTKFGAGWVLFSLHGTINWCHFGFSCYAKLKIYRLQHLCRGEW